MNFHLFSSHFCALLFPFPSCSSHPAALPTLHILRLSSFVVLLPLFFSFLFFLFFSLLFCFFVSFLFFSVLLFSFLYFLFSSFSFIYFSFLFLSFRFSSFIFFPLVFFSVLFSSLLFFLFFSLFSFFHSFFSFLIPAICSLFFLKCRLYRCAYPTALRLHVLTFVFSGFSLLPSLFFLRFALFSVLQNAQCCFLAFNCCSLKLILCPAFS
jgi:hypothetical protein